MIRTPLAVTALLCFAACQQAAKAPANEAASSSVVTPAPAAQPTNNSASTNAATASGAATRVAVPASYDWTFITHGGSGELAFGDGDPAEGVSLLVFSCLPGMGRTEISSIGEGDVSIGAETVRATVTSGAALPVDHPALRGLRTDGTIVLASGTQERLLAAKPGAGRVAVESFFAYCAAG